MAVAILRYNAGNVRSVAFALERVGVESVLTDDPAALRAASHVIFPGVGEASSAMAYLRERGLDEVIRSLTQPVLGICLGLQLMCEWSEENDTACLGIFPHRVWKFGVPAAAAATAEAAAKAAATAEAAETALEASQAPTRRLKVPQIGWNTVAHGADLFRGIPQQTHFYFVHSYYADIGPKTCAQTNHGVLFSSALAKDNFHAVQFHPEKSAESGARLLKNFLEPPAR